MTIDDILPLFFSQKDKIINIVKNTYLIYMKNNPRSSKKVDYFHKEIKNILGNVFTKEKGYLIDIEKNVSSKNSSSKKRCDIVISRNSIIEIIIPTKIIMSNFKQNRNNYFESLTGELCHLKWENENVFIIPINILMNNTPYLTKTKKIKKFEKIEYKDVQNYNILFHKDLCYDIINIIMSVKHHNDVGEFFDECPFIEDFQLICNTSHH